MLAGHPREDRPSDYEMEIRTQSPGELMREESTGAGGEESMKWAQGEGCFIPKPPTYGVDNPRKNALKPVLAIGINSLTAL